MTERQRPAWAVRLQREREARGWSKAEMARRLRAAIGANSTPLDSLTRQVRDWEAGRHFPRDWASAYAAAFGLDKRGLFLVDTADEPKTTTQREPVVDQWSASEAAGLAAWLESTNVGDGTIGYLADAVRRLFVDYVRVPPVTVLSEGATLQRQITTLLREGRQRLAQTQALLEASSDLLALLTLVAGDVGRYSLADANGYAAWTCADEADSDPARALVLCAQSKTARWEDRFADAAALARRGFELCPPSRPRILLAVCEATALQSHGDIPGAWEAMRRAQQAREEIGEADEIADAWACPRPRQAAYALQVGLGARDPAAMLREVQAADDAWADGDPWVYGTWAQIRIGAALAHVMTGDPDAAAGQLGPVFDLGPEYRVVTITGRMAEVGHRLGHSRYKGDSCAADLRDQIRAFQAGSLERRAVTMTETP